MFCAITKELSQNIKDVTTENDELKSPRTKPYSLLSLIFRIFTQPQIKSALETFGDQLDWIKNLLDDYMKDNKKTSAINRSDSRAVDNKKKQELQAFFQV
jgi:hypothetical protein